MNSIEYHVVRLECGEEKGNAVLIDNNRALTVKHCIQPNIDDSVPIYLSVYSVSDEDYKEKVIAHLHACTSDGDGYAILTVEGDCDWNDGDIRFAGLSMKPFESYGTFGFDKNNSDKPKWKQLKSNTGAEIVLKNEIGDMSFFNQTGERSVAGLSGSPIFFREKSNIVIGLVTEQKRESGIAIEISGISVSSQEQFLRGNGISICDGNIFSGPFCVYYEDAYEKMTSEAVEPLGGISLLGEIPLIDGYIEPYITTQDDERISAQKYLKRWVAENKKGIIVLYGEPGQGKTSLCRKAMYDFAYNGWLNNYKKNVLHVSLNTNEGSSDDEGIISYDDLPRKKKEMKVFDNALVFFDGFDERYDVNKGYAISTFIESEVIGFLKAVSDVHIVITARKMRIEDEIGSERHLKEYPSIQFCKMQPMDIRGQDCWINAYCKYLEGKGGESYQKQRDYCPIFDEMRMNAYGDNSVNSIRVLLEIPVLFRMIVAQRYHPEGEVKVTEMYRNLFNLTLWRGKRSGKKEDALMKIEDIALKIYENDEKSVCLMPEEGVDSEEQEHNPQNRKIAVVDGKPWSYWFYTRKKENDCIGFYHQSFYRYFLARGIVYSIMERKDNELIDFLRHLARRRLDDITLNYIGELSVALDNRNSRHEKAEKVYDILDRTDGVLKEMLIINEWPDDVSYYERANNLYWNCICICTMMGCPIKYEKHKCAERIKDYDMEKARLNGAVLTDLDLSYAKLSSADLSKARFNDKTKFISSDLRRAILNEVQGYGTDFTLADLNEAQLIGANIDDADFRSARIDNANLSGALLRRANFSSASLKWADLRAAHLHSADFAAADLRIADFRSANLCSAGFRYAKTYRLKIDMAKMYPEDIKDSGLSDVDLSKIITINNNCYRIPKIRSRGNRRPYAMGSRIRLKSFKFNNYCLKKQ